MKVMHGPDDECHCCNVSQEALAAATERAERAEAREAELRAALETAREWADRIHGDERVCGWVHGEDYGLYCLLADCPVDFNAALAASTDAAGWLAAERERVVQETREACAKVAEGGGFLHDDAPSARFGKDCAAAIRRAMP
jgi:hypothetical protein